MSVLLLSRRPEVMFDPTNKDHRKWAAGFFKTNSWRECPVRFVVRDSSIDLTNVLKRQLVEFYTAKEFKH